MWGSSLNRLRMLLYDWPLVELLQAKKVKRLGDNILEYIISIKKNEFRILFVMKKEVCYLLSAFQKKSQKTPLKEIRLAQKRSKLI
jgi:phage-related protein